MARASFGYIISTPSGRHRGRYRIGGKDYYTPTVRTRSQVRADLAAIRDQIRDGTWVEPQPYHPSRPREVLTLHKWFDTWFATLKTEGRSQNTLRSYESIFKARILPVLGTKALRSITVEDVAQLRSHLLMRYAPNTVKNTMLTFSACMSAAVEKELIEASPVKIKGAMSKTRRMRNPVALSVAELRTLIDALDDYYRAAIALASWGALRYSEVAPRTRSDIDLDTGTVKVHSAVQRAPGGKLVLGPPKSEAGYRTVSLPTEALEIIRHHLEHYTPPSPSALLYSRIDGPSGYVSDRVLNRQLKLVTKEAKLPRVTMHDLRHTGLTLFGQTGATLADLMHRAGHTDAKTVMIYQHSSATRDRELANKMGS